MTGIAWENMVQEINVIHLQFNVLEPYKDKLAKVAAVFRIKYTKSSPGYEFSCSRDQTL